MMIREIGNLTSLKKAPLYPEGFDPKVVKVWVPKYDEFVKLQRPGSTNGTRSTGIGSELRSLRSCPRKRASVLGQALGPRVRGTTLKLCVIEVENPECPPN